MADERKQILDMLAEGKINSSEAERLLDAIEQPKEIQDAQKYNPEIDFKEKPKYLRVVVEPKTGSGEKVNIKIPLAVIKAGVKLRSIMPEAAKVKVNGALHDRGINLDIDDLNSGSVDQIFKSLSEMKINVDDDKEIVRIFCE